MIPRPDPASVEAAAAVFRVLGQRLALTLYRDLARWPEGLPLEGLGVEAGDLEAVMEALGELEAVGLVKAEGPGSAWYTANTAPLEGALLVVLQSGSREA